MKKIVKKLWIEGLTDGSYKKICGFMRKTTVVRDEDDDDINGAGEVPDMSPKNRQMCVMGVLADIAMRHANLKATAKNWYKFANQNETPTERTLKWAGLTPQESSLMIDMNDDDDISFEKFAKYIKEKL